MYDFDVILGMACLSTYHAIFMHFEKKKIVFQLLDEHELSFAGLKLNLLLIVILALQAWQNLRKG